jgi:hypothetical protein
MSCSSATISLSSVDVGVSITDELIGSVSDALSLIVLIPAGSLLMNNKPDEQVLLYLLQRCTLQTVTFCLDFMDLRRGS